jgi:VWFA-related protein
MRRFLAPLLLLVVALPVLAAHRETQNVEVVQVPVYVQTARGVVTGLTRDNFELFVNGKLQTVDYFDVIDFATIAAPAEGPGVHADPRQRRLYVLLFDLYYAAPNSIHRAQLAAQQLVAHAGAADAFAVARYSSYRGIDVLVPFTKDRESVANAITALRATADADPLRLKFGPPEVVPYERAFDRNPVTAASNDRRAAQELAADQQRLGVEDQIGALGVLADQLAPLEGQKHVVLLSEGYEGTLLHGVEPLTSHQNTSIQSGPLSAPHTPQIAEVNGQAMMQLRRMYKQFATAEVFLDAVDTAGLRHTWNVGENESLYALTRDTGGTVVDNRNDLTEALQVLTDRQRVVYVLGFHNRDKGRSENKIAVRLRNVEGHPTVSYRPSYSPVAPASSVENGLRLADILTNDIPQNGVTVNASAQGKTVSVSIPAREMLAQIDERGRADAMIYIFSGARAVATKVKRIDIEGERASKAPRDAAIHFDETFDLPPGNYTAKVLVRLGEAMGFARTDFKVAE